MGFPLALRDPLALVNELSAKWHCGWCHSQFGFLQGKSPLSLQSGREVPWDMVGRALQ